MFLLYYVGDYYNKVLSEMRVLLSLVYLHLIAYPWHWFLHSTIARWSIWIFFYSNISSDLIWSSDIFLSFSYSFSFYNDMFVLSSWRSFKFDRRRSSIHITLDHFLIHNIYSKLFKIQLCFYKCACITSCLFIYKEGNISSFFFFLYNVS